MEKSQEWLAFGAARDQNSYQLAWVNARRTVKGLPMIGVPDGDNQVDAYQHARTLTTLETGPLVYDPRRGCYREDLDA